MSDEEWMALYQDALRRMRRVIELLDAARVAGEAVEAKARG